MLKTEKRVSTWDELWQSYLDFTKHPQPERWIFRGQGKAKDGLTTTLERIVNRGDLRFDELPTLEDDLIRAFRRQAHHHLQHIPDKDDPIQWLSLMQHYGAPTRLLDWSYSFFVALYFAVEESESDCALWALDLDWLVKLGEAEFKPQVADLLDSDPRLKSGAFFSRVFKSDPAFQLVHPLNPEILNDRLIIQQGLFLCPGNISMPLEENLANLQNKDRNAADHLVKLNITIPVDFRREILRHLHRMNMNRATLFSGFAGFSQSLKYVLANSDIIKGRLPFT